MAFPSVDCRLLCTCFILLIIMEPAHLVSICNTRISGCECIPKHGKTDVWCVLTLQTEFNFSNFQNVSEVPPDPWRLIFAKEQNAFRYLSNPKETFPSWKAPLVIPRNTFPLLMAVKPRINLTLHIRNVHLVSIEKEAFSISGMALQSVSFVETQMSSLPIDSFLEHSASLKRIGIRRKKRNGTPIRPPQFQHFQALKEIYIKNTAFDPPRLLDRTLYDLPSLTSFIVAGSTVVNVSVNAFQKVANLVQLEISDSGLQRVPLSVSHIRNLESLNLTGNSIMDVRGGDLDSLREAASLQVLIMANNPFSCTCDLLPFIEWLVESNLNLAQLRKPVYDYVYNWDVTETWTYSCNTPEQLQDTSLLDLGLVGYLQSNCSTKRTSSAPTNYTTNDFAENSTVTRLTVSITSAVVVLSIALITVTVLMHRKLNIKWVGLFRRYDAENVNNCHQAADQLEGARYDYDAFICHHDSTDGFVADMIPRIEEEPNNFRLCVSFRDFLVGADELTNVTRALEKSRAVIILLDGEFIASGQCLLELNMACSQMMASVDSVARPNGASLVPGSETRLLLVLMDALPVEVLPATLRALRDKITCLEWDVTDEDRCWQQLTNSLHALRVEPAEQEETSV